MCTDVFCAVKEWCLGRPTLKSSSVFRKPYHSDCGFHGGKASRLGLLALVVSILVVDQLTFCLLHMPTA